MDKEEREALITLLKEYKDVFAYDYDEMPGLDSDLVVHNLGVSPEFKTVKQRSREFSRATALAIKEEVERLLTAKFIKTIQHPTWLANIVPVTKKNGKVRLHTSTPYYPKGNGQAEATNETLICILSRIVHDHHREWHEQLSMSLWAYRISKRSSTGASPYSLVYGEDAILPAEITIPSARVAMASHTTPDEVSRFAHLDTIEERRTRAERFAEAYRKRAANYYNQSVKERTFKMDELVLKIAPHV
ncbi:uncharacterized protein LOC113359523 [Papaver somniferum]|uniref:uncharacterized protein LOC113359523 n=1 Tax=Papaver somniferum TaxID=3469 RepID=UPI000E705B51|nr:uncharacterized protein LOC113359523 [Papaver somniferum]